MKRNSLKSVLLMGLLSLQFGGFAQEVDKPVKHVHQNNITYKSVAGPDGYVRCHTMEMDSIRRANDPTLPSLEQQEAALQQSIAEYNLNNTAAKKIQYTIPIIFHIFSSGTGSTNVSQAQIQAQLDQLNIDYADQAGSPYAQSADVEIVFCLAQVDENGTPLIEPGINRITSYGNGPFSSGDFDGGMKAATIWDPNEYFNVWVANLSGGLLGYAQFPNSSGLGGLGANNGGANTDGCVILHTTVGSVASPFAGGAPYNRGRTLTHEAGHWLGLRHIWGDGGCSVDDFCADTPASDASNYGCPNGHTSCSSTDMIENYMDYTDDNCMNTFTADQKTRMQTVMGVSPRRSTLGNNGSCNSATDPDDVGVTAILSPTGTICASTFTPEITVTNFGTNDVTSFTLTYDVDGTGAQTFNWTGTLPVGQSVTITLSSMSSSAGNHTFNASTSVPNGNTDTNGANDDGSSSFDLNPAGQEITLILNTDCYGEETVWELFDDNATLVGMGGNTNVTLPVTATQNTSASDPGIYPSEQTVTIPWCLADGCYDFVIWDAYGDGLNGSSFTGCSVDGDYEIQDAQGNVLASMQATDGAFDFSETVNFCVAPPCASTFSSTTVEEDCFEGGDGSIEVTFTAGNSTNATYDIGSGPQSSGLFNNLTQGSYTVTVVDGDMCTSYVNITLGGPSGLVASTGTVNDENTGNDGSININVSGGSPGYSFSWTGTGGFTATTQNISGLSAGTYSVTITDDNGCTAVVNNIVVDSNVGIDELENGEFVVFPNPSEGIFNVALLGEASGEYVVSVMDIAGRLVMQRQIEESEFTLDLTSTATGTYTVMIQTGNHAMIKRVVVK